MNEPDPPRHYLHDARQALVRKLDGLTEYDARRPLTPTATNLLGLVEHVAATELLCLGHAFGGDTMTVTTAPAPATPRGKGLVPLPAAPPAALLAPALAARPPGRAWAVRSRPGSGHGAAPRD